MNKDRVEGRVKDVAGRVERQAGEWAGDPKTQAKGAAKQVEGKVQNAVGKIEDAAKKGDTKTSSKPPQVFQIRLTSTSPRKRLAARVSGVWKQQN
jgi:uncharacterized protein YjbJ (UPF0337 family)